MGVLWFVLGTASAGTGLFFLLSDPVLGMDRNQQYILGSSLVGPGVPVAMLGIRTLLQESVEETSWEAYREMKQVTERSAKASAGPALSVAPLRSGGMATLRYTF
jgi:hypothetical protein